MPLAQKDLIFKPNIENPFGQMYIFSFLSNCNSLEWKMKIVKNHSSVMGALKPLLNLLNYSIIPKSCTEIAKGDGNE